MFLSPQLFLVLPPVLPPTPQLQQMQRNIYYQGNSNPMMMMAGLHQSHVGNGNMAAPLQNWQQQQQQVSAYNRSGQSTQQQVNAMVQMGYPVGNNTASQATSGSQQQAQTNNTAMTQQPMYYAASPMQYYNR